jgi:4-amino-4-deoxy-L-arabinose transferase-like glycosyltransferase
MRLDTPRGLILATAAVFASRLAVVALVTMPEDSNDAVIYHALAVSLAKGQGYVSDGAPHLWFMPGYPLFLAALYRTFGETPWIPRGVQALLVALSAAVVFRFTLRQFGPRAAVIAFVYLAAFPAWFFYPAMLLSEALSLVLVALMLWALAQGASDNAWRWTTWAAATGVVAGALALVKPELVLWAPAASIVAVARGWSLRRVVAVGCLSIAACFVVLAPWVVRNAVVFDRFIPLSVAGPAGFWSSAHRPALMDWGEPEAKAAFVRCGGRADDGLRARLSGDPQAVARCLTVDGIRMIGEHPVYWLGAGLRRAVHSLFGSHTEYVPGYRISFHDAWHAGNVRVLTVKTSLLVIHVTLVTLGLVAIVWLSWSRRWYVLAYMVVTKSATHALVFGTPRYGLVFTPIFAVAGGAAVCAAVDVVRQWRRRAGTEASH